MTERLIHKLKKLCIGLVVCIQVLAPVTVWADEAQPADASSTGSEQQSSPPAEASSSDTSADTQPTPTTGPQKPTGADAKTYTYNKTTGLWENEHYTWNPATGQTKPKQTQDYSYNPATKQWDTTQWYYSPESGKYLPNTVSSASNPPALSTSPTRTTAVAAGSQPVLSSRSSISNTGSGSNNTITGQDSTQGTFDLFFDATISNKIGQLSRSGDAAVQGNTTAGNAASGDATALANILSMLQSTWGSLGNQDLSVFMASIDGDVVGDLYVDPGALAQNSGNNSLDVTVANDAAIYNDVNVDVASGNVLVTGNTKAGNAISGDATAVVNLLNLINSAITANKSFIGVLNIHGSLNGDILLPPSMLNAIIAATGPGSNNQITGGHSNTVNVTSTDNKTINNDINTNVQSGNATVSGNTSAGNATTGQASSNVVLLNLTGQRVIAKNALLVFVNVMGSWVGLIFNAPAGTTAVAATGSGSNNTIDNTGKTNLDVTVANDSLIDNNINVTAASGDATVTHNTTAGDAKTGDAAVGVNVLNMIDSQFDISDWFGILFINVFGKWVGSFGVNTDAGTVTRTTGVVAALPSATASTTTATDNTVPQTLSFVPRATGSARSTAAAVATPVDSGQPPAQESQPMVAGTSTNNDNGGDSIGTSAIVHNNAIWAAAAATLFGALLLAGERIIAQLRSKGAI